MAPSVLAMATSPADRARSPTSRWKASPRVVKSRPETKAAGNMRTRDNTVT